MFVYILKCSDDKYYVGTYRGADIETRIGEHNNRTYADAWTASRLPVVLLWSVYFERSVDAIDLEKRLKKWSRAKKEAFMSGDFEMLKSLSVSRTAPADHAKSKFRRLAKEAEKSGSKE